MNKVVSFSLFGTDERYLQGALDNANMFEEFYPNWEMRIYYDASVDVSLMDKLKEFTFVNAIEMSMSNRLSGMFWRFLVVDEPDTIVVIRDIDGRPIVRDIIAVNYWLSQTDKKAHTIYDHSNHYCDTYPMFGGMWGIRNGLNQPITALLEQAISQPVSYMHDMKFLTKHVWPQISNDVVIFDGLGCMKDNPNAVEIPHFRTDYKFIGEAYFNSLPCPVSTKIMKETLTDVN